MSDFERVTSEGAEIDAYRLAVPSGWIYLTPKGPLFVPAPPLPPWPHPQPPEVPTRQPICGCKVGDICMNAACPHMVKIT